MGYSSSMPCFYWLMLGESVVILPFRFSVTNLVQTGNDVDAAFSWGMVKNLTAGIVVVYRDVIRLFLLEIIMEGGELE